MLLEIVQEVMPLLYLLAILSFVENIATFKNKDKGYMSEKEYYHGLHAAIEKIIATLYGEKVDKEE